MHSKTETSCKINILLLEINVKASGTRSTPHPVPRLLGAQCDCTYHQHLAHLWERVRGQVWNWNWKTSADRNGTNAKGMKTLEETRPAWKNGRQSDVPVPDAGICSLQDVRQGTPRALRIYCSMYNASSRAPSSVTVYNNKSVQKYIFTTHTLKAG